MLSFPLLLFCLTLSGPVCTDLSQYEQPAFEDLPALVTYYDPSLGGINCDSDCSIVADGTRITEALYGTMAACDRRLLGTTVEIDGLGSYDCKDTGGMIKPTWSKHYGQWILYFDIMLHETPLWNYMLFDDWRVIK